MELAVGRGDRVILQHSSQSVERVDLSSWDVGQARPPGKKRQGRVGTSPSGSNAPRALALSLSPFIEATGTRLTHRDASVFTPPYAFSQDLDDWLSPAATLRCTPPQPEGVRGLGFRRETWYVGGYGAFGQRTTSGAPTRNLRWHGGPPGRRQAGALRGQNPAGTTGASDGLGRTYRRAVAHRTSAKSSDRLAGRGLQH